MYLSRTCGFFRESQFSFLVVPLRLGLGRIWSLIFAKISRWSVQQSAPLIARITKVSPSLRFSCDYVVQEMPLLGARVHPRGLVFGFELEQGVCYYKIVLAAEGEEF